MIEADMSEVFAMMNSTLGRLRRPQPVMMAAAELGAKSVKARIKSLKTTPDGQPWANWSPITADRRSRRGNAGNGLLFDTGALYQSVDWKATGKTGEVSAGASYAQYLQEGTKRMPARPFMGWDKPTIRGVETLFEAWVNGDKK